MTADEQGADHLRVVAERRAVLAERARVPVWFALLYLAGLVLVFLLPALAPNEAGVVTFLVALTVLSLVDAVASRRAGFDVSLSDVRRFPSVRGPRDALLLVLLTGSAATWLCTIHVSVTASAVVGIAVAVAVAVLRVVALRAVRRDLSSGRAR